MPPTCAVPDIGPSSSLGLASFVSSLDKAIDEGNAIVKEGEELLDCIMDDETAHKKREAARTLEEVQDEDKEDEDKNSDFDY